eukprot:jgi/Phyca11/114117/e_gw1.25.622.1
MLLLYQTNSSGTLRSPSLPAPLSLPSPLHTLDLPDSIPLWKKKEVLDWVNLAGDGIPGRAVSHFRSRGWDLHPGTVRRWCRNREDIWAAKPYQQRRSGGGRKKALRELEDLLLEAIVLRRLKKEKVTRE